ncbi:MAG: ABC transporter ATP-binding protein [Alphaproteobacteria bacterium]|nr:ABC transporter ATP-binding protein [Alphaproteobacteria bacterium]
MSAVEFKAVGKSFGPVAAVKDISFVIPDGKLATILGPSGCGKTTTLRLIAGLELPDSGSILIGGRDVSRLAASARDVTMVFQSYALFPHMTVAENVGFGLSVAGLPPAEIRRRVESTLAMLGLEGLAERQPSELSGGQQQRVAIARSVVLEPEVLLFDEPLSNLDAKLRRRVREEIRDLQRKLNLTVAYVTHDQDEALAVSDLIVVMDRGAIVQAGAPRDLYERPANRFIAGFMGEATLVKAELTAVSGSTATVRLGDLAIDLPARDRAPGPVELAIRPEALKLGRGEGAGLKATVLKASYVGHRVEYTLATDIGELFCVAPPDDAPFKPGESARVTLSPRGTILV